MPCALLLGRVQSGSYDWKGREMDPGLGGNLTLWCRVWFLLLANWNIFVFPLEEARISMPHFHQLHVFFFFLCINVTTMNINTKLTCIRCFQDGMSIGPPIKYMMETWSSFRVKRRSFFQSQWKALLMSIRSTQSSHSHPLKQTALSWHFVIGSGNMATANPSGLALVINNLCRQQSYQNSRYGTSSSLAFNKPDPNFKQLNKSILVNWNNHVDWYHNNSEDNEVMCFNLKKISMM